METKLTHIWIPCLGEIEMEGPTGSCPSQFGGQLLPVEFQKQGSPEAYLSICPRPPCYI